MFAKNITTETDKDGGEKLSVNGVDFSEISAFILALIIPSYVKRNFKFTQTYTVYDIFYECLYRYSHKRLENALSIASVACVFQIFLESEVFDDLLEHDSTLSKNREAYEQAKSEFLHIISKKRQETK